jgi:hypothetical protein
VLKRRFLFAAAALALASSVLAFASCKSDDISQTNNNTDQYDTFVTQSASPDVPTTIDGPDGSRVVIEAHALASTTPITIGKMKAGNYPDLPGAWASSGGVYSFEPHAQTFALPVHITVPYTDKGQPVRLVTAEPGGNWSLVDGVNLSGGTVKLDSSHFSFYTVVTGAPIDTTPHDSGVDSSISDATTQDSPADSAQEAEAAAPPSPPTVFIATSSNVVYRSFAIDPYVDGGADAGGSDGGWLTVSQAGPMAVGTSPFTLFVGQTAAADAGGGVQTVNDPFGLFTLGAQFPLAKPGAVAFINGELWVLNPTTSHLETWVGGVKTWNSTQTITGGAFAYDPVSTTIFVLQPAGPNVLPFKINNADAGNGKSLSPQTTWNNLTASAPNAIIVAPWGDVILCGNGLAVYDKSGGSLSKYGTVNSQTCAGIGIAHWPSGRDELFVADNNQPPPVTPMVLRYTLDTGHTTATPNGSILSPGKQTMTGVIVAP